MTKDQRSEIEWAFDALQEAHRNLWEAERTVLDHKRKLAAALDAANTSTPLNEFTLFERDQLAMLEAQERAKKGGK